MAVKRTNNLSKEISGIDRRVKTLESSTALGSVSGRLTTASAPSTTDNGTPDPVETVVSATAPFTYKRVQEAYFYDDSVTGNGSRAELYFSEDPQISLLGANTPPQISNNYFVRVSGIRGNTNSIINISSANFSVDEVTGLKHKVYAIDSSPWNDKDFRGAEEGQLRQSWRDEPGAGITHTVFYNPKISFNSNAGVQLIAKRLIDSVSASNTTVVVTTNSMHRFAVGDVVSVDLNAPLYGLDGLFKVETVPNNTSLTYTLDESLASPINLSGNALGTKYVYPVAQRFVPDGTIWIENDVTPNKVYVWKELRWYDTADPIGDVAAVKDGIAPSPVTNLTATSTTIPGVNGQGGTAEITVSWTPPTTRSNGDPIADYLGYYEIQYKRTTEANWTGKLEVDGSASSAIIRDPFIRLQTQYDIRVYVYDIMEQASTAVSTTVTTTNFSETLNAPSTPILTTRLGTITVTWDGLDSVGNTPPQGVQYVEVHYSTTTGFTPGAATLYTTFPITLQGNYAVVSNLNYNTTYYFKLIFVRSDGYTNQKSAASTQASAQVSPLVDTDIIYSTLNNWPFNGGVVPAGALASGAISASNMFGSNVVVQNAIAANAIGANQIAANSVIAGKIGADAITANTIAAGAITAGKIAANAIEADTIAAGAITASIIGSKEIELKANSTATQRIVLNASGITAYNGGDTTFSINGVSGTINAAAITVSNVNASNITTGSLSADRIAAESITAGKLEADLTMTKLIKTGAAGTNRIEIRGSTIANPGIVHLDGSGGSNFRFYANGFSYLNNLELDTATLSGTLTVNGTISGGTIRTAASGKRVVLSGSTNEIIFYGTGGSELGSIGGATTTISYQAGTGHSFQVGGATVFSITSTGIGLAPGEIFTSNLPVDGTITSTSSVTAETFVRSGTGAGTFATLHSNGGISSSGGPSPSTGEIQAGSLISSGGVVQVSTMNASTTNPIVRWSGGSRVALTVGGTSDERIKDNIEPLNDSLSKLNQVDVVKFTSRLTDEDDEQRVGVIAQQIEQVDFDGFNFISQMDTADMDNLPEDFTGDSIKLVNYEAFTPFLIKAIQELSAKNEALEARIAALEGTT